MTCVGNWGVYKLTESNWNVLGLHIRDYFKNNLIGIGSLKTVLQAVQWHKLLIYLGRIAVWQT